MATNARPLIRLSLRSYATLKALSKEMGKAMSDVVGDAIERYSRDQFWEQVKREFELMTPAQLRAYRKEVALWDGTLLDGLLDEDWEEERLATTQARTAAGRRVVGRSRSRPRP